MRKAMTLIEVLYAIFLIAVAASVVAATMPIANVSRAKASMVNRAMGLAQKELEAVRGSGYSNLTASQLLSLGLIDSATATATNTYSFTNCDSSNSDSAALILPSGTGSILIEQADIDLKRVTVTVSWSDRGVTKSFTTGTLVANL